MSVMRLGIDAVERGLVPDAIVRAAIRQLCRRRLRDCAVDPSVSSSRGVQSVFVESMRSGPIALLPEKANEQHYEVPPEFFGLVLGPHRKYSSCVWTPECCSLAEAEAAALAMTCERAGLRDGQDVLELGCGWGSLSLWMAEQFPGSRITSVSNSALQRQFIESEIARRELTNLTILTADMNDFQAQPRAFDRVVSVEMFEHMRNYEMLLQRIAGWLRPDGQLFVHHFCHRSFTYPFESRGTSDWMAQYFFSGGIMPGEDLLTLFPNDMRVADQWRLEGTHYQRTSEAWLKNLDRHRGEVMAILKSAYGSRDAVSWFHRWRVFFLAVAELFGYRGGQEWFVAHVLLKPAV